MKRESELLKQLSNNKKACELKIGNIDVEMKYSNNRNINECMLNILKQKIKKG